jgi:hypothetical protein
MGGVIIAEDKLIEPILKIINWLCLAERKQNATTVARRAWVYFFSAFHRKEIRKLSSALFAS